MDKRSMTTFRFSGTPAADRESRLPVAVIATKYRRMSQVPSTVGFAL
jgi:hypothetical protein